MKEFLYRLSKPLTSISATGTGAHVRVGLWVNHAKAGELTVRNEEYLPFLKMISRIEDADCLCVACVDGEEVIFMEDLSKDEYLISKQGRVVTVRDLVKA